MTPLTSPEFIGRAAELTALRDALAHARGGTPTTVLLGGEAGVGKSRLVAEFATEAERAGASIVVGHCVDVGGEGLAYAPIAAALRQVVGQIGAAGLLELAGPGRAALAGLLPELGIEAAPASPDARGRLFEVVTVLLERSSATDPLIFVIEDLQWADRSTRDLMRFAIRALGTARLLLLSTYRSDELPRPHPLRPLLAELDRVRTVQRLEVPRLRADEVGAQLAGILGAPAAAEVVRDVHRRSEGVPFLVEQLAELDSSDAPLPASLRDLLLVKVERLSDAGQQMVRMLSVGRDHVDHELIRAVAGSDPGALDDAVREAVSAGVLRVDGDGYAFQHALVREAVHADLLPGEHARLHARYADILEQHRRTGRSGAAATTAEIAHHWYCAHELERSLVFSLEAGAEALGQAAYGEALQAFERALELWPRVPDAAGKSGSDHVDVLERASTAAFYAGEVERSLALIEAAVSETDVDAEPLRVAGLLASCARLTKELGRADSLHVIHRALDLVPADPPSKLRARLQQMLGAGLMMEGHPGAVDVSREAATMAHVTGAADVEFRAYVVLGPSLVSSGHVDDGLQALRTARDLVGDGAEALATYHVNTSDVLYLLGRYEEAAEVARDGIERARETGMARSLGPMLAGNAAEPLLATGNWDEAERMIARGLGLAPQARHAWQLLRLQAWLLLWRGDLDAARDALHEVSKRVSGRLPGPQYVLPQARCAAELALAAGDHDEAWRQVTCALDDAADPPGHELPVLAAGAWALELRARADGPAAVAADATMLRERMDRAGDWGIGTLWRAVLDAHLGGVTSHDPDAWRAVADAVSAAGGPVHLLPYAGFRVGAALLAHGEQARAAKAFEQAATRADDLGAGLVRGWIDRLHAPGAQRPPGLTERELDVLQLVAAGRSNRQIGAELVISPKTASVHVSNILAKLGVSSRGEAAAVAHRDGLVRSVSPAGAS